jgi:hypothetical protein
MKWKPALYAPRDAWPVAIAVTLTCDCGKGGRVVLIGARQNGEWIFQTEFNHRFDITHFLVLEKPPATATATIEH